jgi:hypothetical protein
MVIASYYCSAQGGKNYACTQAYNSFTDSLKSWTISDQIGLTNEEGR